MSFLTSLFGSNNSPDPARLNPLVRNGAQRINLSEFRKPWHNYWTEPAGEGFYVVGGPKRHATIMIPTIFPTRAVARSVAKYMIRSSRIRVNGSLVR